jgi:hypothetical protein
VEFLWDASDWVILHHLRRGQTFAGTRITHTYNSIYHRKIRSISLFCFTACFEYAESLPCSDAVAARVCVLWTHAWGEQRCVDKMSSYACATSSLLYVHHEIVSTVVSMRRDPNGTESGSLRTGTFQDRSKAGPARLNCLNLQCKR